ncbi:MULTISPECIES: ABC transporter substrate-binding protein [Microbacterium]|uniref:Sugar ABC transporter substrate-binding protein n=1 Tax=Microbacterium testaceum TaxID=2033 RepID=A0A147F377_MICTE|nr:ABC transporter substrate-binding protein [Microbacterium testaceum]KTS05495.1 sugar ABC transporter substrate-binding protein [Microbacterium testaceum]KTS05544.1 sugar ABC transporter substrate-binding protein [Microbacterium testaceum]KTS64374.1 sugar ABC transporter substrate-binding protein [Microbacterium testaceum]KTS91820.1 sugar ABC transporter substrate-binding protein [Microbacterium testaceum]
MPQHSSLRSLRLPLLAAPLAGVLILAGCSGNSDSGGGDSADGFTVMVAQANDDDQSYAKTLEAYGQEKGLNIEVIPYPSEAYNTQVTTQLQAGNAADVMILAPGTGQPISVISLAQAGLLAPLGDSSASLVPANAENQYEVDGKVYAQPTALIPVGLVYNNDAAKEAGLTAYPDDYESLLADCKTARDAGKSFTVLAGAITFNTGLMAQLISATRVYEATPDWNEQRAAGKVTFADTEGWKETLQDLVDMNSAGCFQDGAAGGTFDNITAGLGGGTALSAAVPGSAASSIGAATGADLTVQSFPPSSGQKPFVLASANYAWGVNAKTSDAKKKLIQDFLDWVATPDQAKAFADSFGGVPIVGASEDSLLPQYKNIGSLLESNSYTGLPNAAWPNPGVYDALGAGVQGLLTGQKTVDQVLADMDSAWG